MRVTTVAIGLFALFSLLILQFYQVQIVQNGKWLKIARSQHELVVKEPANRGRFFSNVSIKGGHPESPQPFVIDVPKFHLFADPLMIPKENKSDVIQFLQKHLDRNSATLRNHLEKKSRSRKLATWLLQKNKIEIETWWKGYARKNKLPSNALFFVQDHHRSYPFGSLLGPILHTIRDDGAVPTGGLELYFNKELVGTPGKRLLLRSPSRPFETGKVLETPKHGRDITLTINHTLQAIAEEEIEKGVHQAKAKGGTAIVMDPVTGAILAFAQYPFFDPSNYRDYFNDLKLIDRTKVKGITDCFEIGSTMKPITVAIAMLANEELDPPLFTTDEVIDCSRGEFPGRRRPIRDVGFHKKLTMPLAIQKSSNIYVARLVDRIVNRLGDNWYRDKLENVFGFSKPTGIELPSEARGMLPTPGKMYKSGHLEWSKPTPCSLAIGYNLLATPLQVLRAFSILANDGLDVQPTLILDKAKPQTKRLLPSYITTEVIDALKAVTKLGGTCSLADIHGFTEVAKSGTSEKLIKGRYSKTNHFSSIVGFTPAHGARLACIVVIDDPEYRYLPGIGKMIFGGKCAAPPFRAIMQRSLKYLGITPDDPYGYPKGDPRFDPEKADWLKEVKDLKALYNKLNG